LKKLLGKNCEKTFSGLYLPLSTYNYFYVYVSLTINTLSTLALAGFPYPAYHAGCAGELLTDIQILTTNENSPRY